MSVLVYQSINAIASELADGGVAKRHRNEEGDYSYRSIEDVMRALAPLLARHKLCVLPRFVERGTATGAGLTAQPVLVKAAFDLVSALDGSTHTIESFGEAYDESDKGTAKAISAAYKAAMLQAFCIPVPLDDADAVTPSIKKDIPLPEPAEGWETWAGEVIHIVQTCDSAEAIERLGQSRRQRFAALQRARPDLYAKVGEVIATKIADISAPAPPEPNKRRSKRSTPAGVADAATAEAA